MLRVTSDRQTVLLFTIFYLLFTTSYLMNYDHKDIESKWQKEWADNKLYETFPDSDKPKQYILDMFPYPSGTALHVGHPKGYIATDIYSRMKRMQGFNVLHPMGWDAFGLPAEQFALKNKIHPRIAVEDNIAQFKKQLGTIGFDYDWSREINTTDPEYYKWSQWAFIQMHKKGLVHESYEPINWCPSCKTGLANEDLEDGKCERCGSVVIQKPMRQWVIKITDYADRLLDDLQLLDKWPSHIKESQRNWIGKSEGAEINFKIKSEKEEVKSFVIFDFDGVIGDTWEASTSTKALIDNCSKEKAIESQMRYASRRPDHARGASQETLDRSDAWYDKFRTIMMAESGKLGLFDDMVEWIENHSNMEYAIVSSGCQNYINFLLEKTNLKPTHMLAYEDHHSKEEKVEIICKDWGIDLKDVWYVTDTKADVYELSEIIDTKQLIGCSWGYLGREALLEVLPENQVVDTPREIDKIFEKNITVFTTRPDTLFGATYVVLAPEHPLISHLSSLISNLDQVKAYVEKTQNKTELERQQEKEKTGIKLEGVTAVNPVNGEELPVYVADYVLASYGTGAVVAVPAHDERDFEFAKKFDLPIRQVVAKHFTFKGTEYSEKEGLEILKRDVVDAIIRDQDGDFYLIKEGEDHVHLVGGGIDEGESALEALRREVTEEVGFTEFEIGKITTSTACWAYRHTKNKNQRTCGSAYEVILKSNKQTTSEIEEGRHELIKVSPDEVLKVITWDNHRYMVEEYLSAKSQAFTDHGILINSAQFSGKPSLKSKKAITEFAGGKWVTRYKLRDWVFSRQRYWGEPIPMVHDAEGHAYPVDESLLPVRLPQVESYEPTDTGESPLAEIHDWVNVKGKITEEGTFIEDENGEVFKRETNTMPQWAGSSWYYLRYMDPQNSEALVDLEKEKYFAPVDLYVGGAEHATRHLIYARFWHKFLHDIGAVSTIEPFTELHSVGLILAEDGRKMSKRYGNTIDPVDMVNRFGADSFRLYEMFMGPFEDQISWNTDGLVGTRRFLEKVWRIAEKVKSKTGKKETSKEALRVIHETVKKVTDDIQKFRFNTAVSQMMVCVNTLDKEPEIAPEDFVLFLQVLAPFAPHITEELWHLFGNEGSIHVAPWTKADEAFLITESVKIGVQINGKVRTTLELAPDENEASVKEKVMADETVQQWLAEKELVKFIYVPGRIVNIVIK